MGVTVTTSPRRLARPRSATLHVDAPALSAWTLAFSLVAYLAFRDGGYDTVVRSEVAVALWWIVLLAALVGILPTRIPRAGWVAIGLLAGFVLWTGLAIGWSESAERSSIELGRVAAYLGVLVLAIALQGRTAARHTVNGVACAIGLVTLLAVLSRLHPQAFPANDHFQFLGPGSGSKLSYPLNYWNGLAAFAAMGVPLLLAVALGARSLAGRALAAATLPLSALCLDLTISRGGVLALGVGLAAFVVLVPRRAFALGTLASAGTGAAILVWATSQRDALTGGVPTPLAIHQGTQMLWLALIVCLGVGLLQVAIGLADRHATLPAALEPSRRTALLRTAALLAVALVVGIAAGVPGTVQTRWNEFRAPSGAVVPTSETAILGRLQAANGNGRHEFWQAALKAERSAPLTGIGPGTFEFWWARHATAPGFIRDAHMLYLETLGETGIVGLLLLGGLLLWLLGVAVARSLRAPPELRLWIGGAAGGVAAFMTSAALEWVWELAAIAVAVMLLGAVIVAGRDDVPAALDPPGPVRPAPRILLALLALACLGAVLIPLSAAVSTRESRSAAARGDLTAALRDSRAAEQLQPYAATPHLQRALLLEEAGALAPAATAAAAATADEPTNWRTWLVRARIDARRGASAPAVDELRRARRLNPRSDLFTAP
jgi:hypothetical protein